MTITLPDEMREEVEAKAKASGFADVTAFVAALVLDHDPSARDIPDDYSGPPELTPRNREDLQRMLDEGMASGDPVIADDAFWAERRRVLRQRMAEKGRGEPA